MRRLLALAALSSACANPVPGVVRTPVAWDVVQDAPVDAAGETEWVPIAAPADARAVAVRISPIDATADANAALCHAVIDTRGRSAPAAVPGPRSGVFVFPAGDGFEVRFGLLDCLTGIPASRARFSGMPTALRVEHAVAARPPTGTSPTVAVRILAADDALVDLDAVTSVAADRFAEAGFSLVVERVEWTTATGELEYTRDMQGLVPLHEEALAVLAADEQDTRFVPVAVVPGLRFEDRVAGLAARPAGQTTRVPGSLSETTAPSMVVLAADAPPERAGLVLAHEIGHYLGLVHGDGLMDANIAVNVALDAARFTPADAEIMRRHPDVAYE